MKGANNTYFGSIKEAIKTTLTGAKLTVKHLKDAVAKERRDATTADDENYFAKKEGIVTLQYPKEQIPVPDNGRYKLHNEMDDCIVCDKCAKICPVNCIDIEPIKSTETIGETSDGTPKRLYAAKFDIDMAKCCFCGLCTTVCPTECLTMTKDYDFSTFDVTEMNFGFATLTEKEAEEKRLAYEKAQEAKKVRAVASEENTPTKPSIKKVVRPIAKKTTASEQGEAATSKPVFKPKMKAKPVVKQKPNEETEEKPKPVFKPKMKARPVVKKASKDGEASESSTAKPVYKPKIKPVIKAKKTSEESSGENEKPKPKVTARARPVIKKPASDAEQDVQKEQPKYRPKMKAKIKPVIKKKHQDKDKPKDQDD